MKSFLKSNSYRQSEVQISNAIASFANLNHFSFFKPRGTKPTSNRTNWVSFNSTLYVHSVEYFSKTSTIHPTERSGKNKSEKPKPKDRRKWRKVCPMKGSLQNNKWSYRIILIASTQTWHQQRGRNTSTFQGNSKMRGKPASCLSKERPKTLEAGSSSGYLEEENIIHTLG